MSDPTRPQKGFLGKSGLPAAQSYPRLEGRNRLLALGAAVSVAGVIVLGVGLWSGGANLASAGPLSSSHAGLEGGCESCHDPFQPVADEKCRACHEPAAHAVGEEPGPPCVQCHREHRGRAAAPVSRADEHCLSCHSFAPFASAHQDFRSAEAPGESVFPHPLHLAALETDFGLTDLEEACEICHDGSGTGNPAGDSGITARMAAPLCRDCHGEAVPEVAGGLLRWAANFDHGSHEIQLGCLECHGGVREDGGESFPRIANCRGCHDGDRAPDGCTHCHRYHWTPGE